MNDLIELLENSRLDAIADFDIRHLSRYQYHIDHLSNMLNIIDGRVMNLMPVGFLQVDSALSESVVSLFRYSYVFDFLIRRMRDELKLGSQPS